MYGEWITLDLGDRIKVKVWVFCTRRASLVKKKAAAIAQLKEYVAKQMEPSRSSREETKDELR